MFKANILTIFPEMFPSLLGQSLAGKALSDGLWQINPVNIRDFATDNYRSVDDAPFGGGAGMVMKPDVLGAALDSVKDSSDKLIYLSPRGTPLTQSKVKELAGLSEITLVCGRFEGIDERVITRYGLEEISIGDFVLSGGEPAAICLLDAVIRLIPDVLGSPASLTEESFENGLLEYPQYTHPRSWQGMEVPEVLLSGNHKEIASWRKAQAEKITKDRRPDLWQHYINN
jgi:tRNA (guanine37-N1)-methyltransferase